MTRQTKTEQERAEEALGIAARRVEKLTALVKGLEKDLKTARDLLTQAQQLHTYRSQHPALRPPPREENSTTHPTKEGSTPS